jgi:SAM-dependent methyltransferase/SOS-response transcriptional repressor LexA
MDRATADYYAKNATQLAVDYAKVDQAYHFAMDRYLEKAHRILDVGCGTGRDCLHLLKQGKDAYGTDASDAMLQAARANLEHAEIDPTDRLINAALPHLNAFEDDDFDAILCNAVLMHLPEESIFDAVYSFKRILRPGGTLLISIPVRRPGIDPLNNRAPDGRLFTPLEPANLQLLLERVGFLLQSSETISDSLGREGYTWNRSAFKLLDNSFGRPLQLVESILNRDDKVATYKLALIRALAEIAQSQHHFAVFTVDEKVSIPVSAIAEKWMLYYWPIFAQKDFIRQGTSSGKSDVAIRSALTPLINHYSESGQLSGFYVDWKSARLSPAAKKLVGTALSKLKSTIWNMPVRHAGGGNFEVFQYDRISKAVLMDVSLWRELSLMGSWIQDATVLRWAELTEQINRGTTPASRVIDCLLTVPNAGRNVEDARRYFTSLPDRTCVWTERPLPEKFAVDHAMPFVLWRNNDLWNLFPADPHVNNRKSDRLPSYDLLHRQRDRIVDYWQGLHSALGKRFSREAQTLLGRDPFDPGNWENRLFTRFVEAFEITASQRGAPRWDPVNRSARTDSVKLALHPKPPPYPQQEEKIYGIENPTSDPQINDKEKAANIIPFHKVGKGAFTSHLPIVASLAAGDAFHGFETGCLTDAEELEWIRVPARLIKPGRFVVRVAGDSMEPTLNRGQLAIFEYHRTPRRPREIVIANLPEFGNATDGTQAIKRINQDKVNWIFESDNPNYNPILVPKESISHPILGCFVEDLLYP